MKVKVRKYKKTPAPVEAEQVLREIINDKSKPLPFITDEPSAFDLLFHRKKS